LLGLHCGDGGQGKLVAFSWHLRPPAGNKPCGGTGLLRVARGGLSRPGGA
jgi:hypothetical protein